MPTFPDGSRVWVTDNKGNPLPEYGEQVEVDEARKTHTRTVYIPAEKGAEFEMRVKLTKFGEPCKVNVLVDGNRSHGFNRVFEKRGRTKKIKGWNPTSTTLQRFAFGEAVTNEEAASAGGDRAAQLLMASLEVNFRDCYISGTNERNPASGRITLAGAVHPDSKVALAGLQVKTGSSSTLAKPVLLSTYKLKHKPEAIEYSARFLYRQASFLAAMSLMPVPSPAALSDVGVNAQAGPSNNKRKHSAIAKTDAGAAAGGSESAEQRKKRFAAEMQAFKQEFGEEAVLGALESSNEAGVPVKKENGESSSGAIDVDAGPKNQKIFLDLSFDSDGEA